MKRLRKKSDIPWAFFDLSSVAAGSQSAMQQYYLSTIYILLEYEYISLAIIRSVSLRLQNEGQKTHGSHRCTRSLWHGFFWPYLLMHRDYKRICKRDRLRLQRKWRNEVRRPKGKPMKNEGKKEKSSTCTVEKWWAKKYYLTFCVISINHNA